MVRPSGCTPTQLMPAPQVTATPQGRPAGRTSPARSTANVSLATVVLTLQPCAASIAASCSSSSGRSALAMQAMVCVASAGPPGRPASRAAALIVAPIAVSTCWVGNVRTPGPRPLASTVPSAATRAMSVLLFPPSMARTAGSVGPGGRPPGTPRESLAVLARGSDPPEPPAGRWLGGDTPAARPASPARGPGGRPPVTPRESLAVLARGGDPP